MPLHPWLPSQALKARWNTPPILQLPLTTTNFSSYNPPLCRVSRLRRYSLARKAGLLRSERNFSAQRSPYGEPWVPPLAPALVAGMSPLPILLSFSQDVLSDSLLDTFRYRVVRVDVCLTLSG